MNKQELRKLYLKMRMELSPEEVQLKTERILGAFAELDLSHIQYLHLFYPIVGKAEFNTLGIADFVQSEYPGINLVLSKSNFTNNSLQHILWTNDVLLAINQYGITEPTGGELIHPKQIDMVLIPLLAFDKKGYRVGYGKGFYDRFLAQCRSDVKKIGISFFEPIEEIGDLDPHDIAMDTCVTPDEIWKF